RTGSCGDLDARERNELFEAGRGCPGVERLPGDVHALQEVLRVTAGCDRTRCVEQDRVSRAAALALEDAPDRSSVLGGSASGERVERAPFDAELFRFD